MGRKPASMAQHICGRCTESFPSKKALHRHLQNHKDSEPPSQKCPTCRLDFADSLLLEQHRIMNHRLEVSRFECDRCDQTFDSQRSYNRHRKHGEPCCDALHAKDWQKNARPGYINLDKPRLHSKHMQELEYSGDAAGTPSNMDKGQEYCHSCKKTFASIFAYDCHLLGCTAVNLKLGPNSRPETIGTVNHDESVASSSPSTYRHTSNTKIPSVYVEPAESTANASLSASLPTVTPQTKGSVPLDSLPATVAPTNVFSPRVSSPSAPVRGAASSPAHRVIFVCNINGCQRKYNSEQGLRMHQTDAHGVGGGGLDMYGQDSWMLGQRERERLRSEGLLRVPNAPARGGAGYRGGNRGGRAAPFPAHHALSHESATSGSYGQAPRQADTNASLTLPSLPTSQSIGGPFEMEQARSVCGKMLRLLLQTDTFIHHDGKISVSGTKWTRIGVDRQPAVVGMFEGMCHLPRNLQHVEYVPAPKTFLSEYTAQYPVMEFESALPRDPTKPGLSIVAMACSKITLSNGCHEVVKIAAIDVLTCRVLMSHLVCTDPGARVTNWHMSITGLGSFSDLESARQAGYKILKGWRAARAALFKFIDQDTIIVGHNLRSELDALRIIHGRAVDVSKVVEKAAQGPLSKAQLSLDSWCRDVAHVGSLETDPVFGRDCVVNAFATREIVLWSIKNRDMFEKVAKQKSKEYQLVMKA